MTSAGSPEREAPGQEPSRPGPELSHATSQASDDGARAPEAGQPLPEALPPGARGSPSPEGDTSPGASAPTEGLQDPDLETLRAILTGPEQEALRRLAQRLARLEAQLDDQAALARAIAPALGPALRQEIRRSQDEIVEALYPIVGRLVMRAVAQAMRDLMRAVDRRLETALNWRTLRRKVKAWWSGIPESELALRETLPGSVEQVFLIHRETGLVLWHRARGPSGEKDPDLVGAMLTAIQDFAAEVLGRGDKEGVHELATEGQSILVEFGPYSYVAAVVQGMPPPGLHRRLALRVLDFDSAFQDRLRRYEGDPAELAPAAQELFGELLDDDNGSP